MKQSIAHFITMVEDNPLVTMVSAVAVLLVLFIFGGLLLDYWIERKREREKAAAVERLHKHLQSLPSVKS